MTTPAYATPRSDRPTRSRAPLLTAAALGQACMPWQKQVLDTALEYDPVTGAPAYGTVVVTVPRQAGKTTSTRALSVGRCLALPDYRAWYTAQTRNSARDRFMDAISLLRRGPFADHTRVRLTNGSESVSWANGSQWRLFAPTPDALHGEALDLVVIDEAWIHDTVRGDELLQAAIPAGSTRKHYQTWIISTAGNADSTWLRQWVDAGRDAVGRGATSGVAYFEWSAASGDVDDVIAAHPAVGHTITPDAIRTAHAALPAGEFARAYGNVWTAAGERAIPAAAWDATQVRDASPPVGGPAVVSVDVAPDRSGASIVVAWTHDDTPTVAVAVTGAGVDWVNTELRRLCETYSAPVVVDTMGPGASIVDLLPTSITRRLLTTRDVVTAAQQFYDAVMAQGVAVAADPQLDAAVAHAVTRPVGDGWAWGRRKATGDVTALVAASHALWAHTHPTRVPLLLV